MENTLVSIVTVCYNSEKTIRDAIESVLNQTYSNIEYFIIDGKSKDNTVELAESYREAFAEKGIKYTIVSEKDNGLYDAMNKGISMGQGEIVGMINSDDWYEKTAVETAVKAYEKKRFDLFYASIRLIKKDGTTKIKRSRFDRLPTTRHWNHPTTFIARKAYQEMGLYLGIGVYDDWDLILRFRRANRITYISDEILANFRVGGVSTVKSLSDRMERCMERYRCYRRNGYSPLYMIECFAIEMAKFFIC